MANEASVEDEQFLNRLEAFDIELDDFTHRSHIEMAYVYLCEHDVQTTCTKVRKTLCAFLAHIGVEPSSKYHETITQAWVLVVNVLMECTPGTTSANEFIEAHPELLNIDYLLRHYTKQVLFSDAARASFVKPDLAPIRSLDSAST